MISIIVPIFNAEPFLYKCIDSVLAQSVKEWELVLVNDGSTDASLEICMAYSSQDERIRVVDVPNGGVSSARNHGIDNSTGDYLMFLDADDWLASDALEICVPFIPFYDIIRFSALEIHADHVSKYELGRYEVREDVLRAIVARKTVVACWGALFRKDLFQRDSIRFDTSLKVGEDWLVVARLTERSRKIIYLPDNYSYCYNKTNDRSCTRNMDDDMMLMQFSVLSSIRAILPNGYDKEFSYSKCILILETVYGCGKDAARRLLSHAGVKLSFSEVLHFALADVSFRLKSKAFRFWLSTKFN